MSKLCGFHSTSVQHLISHIEILIVIILMRNQRVLKLFHQKCVNIFMYLSLISIEIKKKVKD